MTDPEDAGSQALSLLAHKVAPFQFDIGFAAASASIRDQIVRAQMVVSGLKRSRLLGPVDGVGLPRPLLICGAGIAGLAAAMEAERLGIGFVLIDKSPYPSGALAGAGNRFLSPTMYEWPASLCEEHNHPRKDKGFLASEPTNFDLHFGEPVLMNELKDTISGIVAERLDEWKTQAQEKRAGNWYLPETTICRGTKKKLLELLKPVPAGTAEGKTLPKISLHRASPALAPRGLQFACILFASGFSPESTTVAGRKFGTPPFWEQDTLTQRFLGLPSSGRRVSALIVGAGDGAIQDALRCLVDPNKGKEPLAIWNCLTEGMQVGTKATSTPAAGDHPTIESILREILSLENYTTTAFMWSGNGDVFKGLDEAHVRLCNNLIRIQPGILDRIEALIRDDITEVHVQRREPFFSRCYPLNRFLIHLFYQALRMIEGRDDLAKLSFGDVEITKIRRGKPSFNDSGVVVLNGVSKSFDIIVLRKGGAKRKFQAIGLTGIDSARVNFGRITPPFMPPVVP